MDHTKILFLYCPPPDHLYTYFEKCSLRCSLGNQPWRPCLKAFRSIACSSKSNSPPPTASSHCHFLNLGKFICLCNHQVVDVVNADGLLNGIVSNHHIFPTFSYMYSPQHMPHSPRHGNSYKPLAIHPFTMITNCQILYFGTQEEQFIFQWNALTVKDDGPNSHRHSLFPNLQWN